MGSLVNERTGQRLFLRAHHVFGRQGALCDTCLQDQTASRIHALIRWSAGAWFIVDHSRNGCLLDGKRLPQGQGMRLTKGQKVYFGPGEDSSWQVCDEGSPASALVPMDITLPAVELSRHNVLPSANQPQLCLYEAEPGQWMVDDGATARVLNDGDIVELAGVRYRMQSAWSAVETQFPAGAGTIEPPLLEFRLSQDEEHTRLQVHCGTQSADLGERSHHYCLATLARKRVSDAQAGYDAAAQGWLESAQLARMLGIEPTHLNIVIYRARDQLMTALPSVTALAAVVERRRGGLRLGDGIEVEIHRGSELESTYRPTLRAAHAA